MTTVYEAFSNVMGDVQGIRKGDRNQQQGFNFRGIDAVLNAVGPALRKHGVIILPHAESIDVERYQTAKGGFMQGVIVQMRYTVLGPEGDSFEGSAYGQASDAGDKAVTKAESVAYRTFLLQALTVPTDEPDPDASSHERGSDSEGGGPRGRRSPQQRSTDLTARINAASAAMDQARSLAELDKVWKRVERGGLAGIERLASQHTDLLSDLAGTDPVDLDTEWVPTGDPGAATALTNDEYERQAAAEFDAAVAAGEA